MQQLNKFNRVVLSCNDEKECKIDDKNHEKKSFSNSSNQQCIKTNMY